MITILTSKIGSGVPWIRGAGLHDGSLIAGVCEEILESLLNRVVCFVLRVASLCVCSTSYTDGTSWLMKVFKGLKGLFDIPSINGCVLLIFRLGTHPRGSHRSVSTRNLEECLWNATEDRLDDLMTSTRD